MAWAVSNQKKGYMVVTAHFIDQQWILRNRTLRICEIKLALRRWLTSDVEIICMMAKGMIENFDKYWQRINGLLAIATILDPRNKMDCVEFYFGKIYGDEADFEIARIRKILDNLVVEYQKNSCEMKDQDSLFRASGKKESQTYKDEDDEYAQAKKTKKRKASVRCEVDHYIEDDPLPDDNDFDIFYWWKRDIKYPTLQRIF